MTRDRDLVRGEVQYIGQKIGQRQKHWRRLGRFTVEKRCIGKIEQLDHQAFVGHFGDDVAQEPFHRVAFAAPGHQGLLDILKLGQGLAVAPGPPADGVSAGVGRAGGGLAVGRPGAVMRHRLFGKDAVPTEGAVAPARNPVHRDRRIEIVRDPLALFFRRRVQQPHQQEERHHGGHEVGVGHFPCPAVVAPATDNLLPFDDDRRRIALRSHPHHPSLLPGTSDSRRRLYGPLTRRILASFSARRSLRPPRRFQRRPRGRRGRGLPGSACPRSGRRRSTARLPGRRRAQRQRRRARATGRAWRCADPGCGW